jgi:DNA-binding NarL/FixJ family response regulator
MNCLDAAEQIKRSMPATKLIFLSMDMEPDVVAEAFRRGASAYVTKQSAGIELAVALRKVIRGESYLSTLIAKDTVRFLLRTEQQSLPRKITPRQAEILQLLAEGMSMKEVANTINVRPGTVAFHKYKMMEVLGITTNAELLGYAMKLRRNDPSANSFTLPAPI